MPRFKADRDEEYRQLLDKYVDFGAEIERGTTSGQFTYAQRVFEPHDENK